MVRLPSSVVTRTVPDTLRVEASIATMSRSGTLNAEPVLRRGRKRMRSLVSTRSPISREYRPSIIRKTVSESVREDSNRATYTSERWSEAMADAAARTSGRRWYGARRSRTLGRSQRNHDIVAPSSIG
jgi:hypothetical protein